MKFNTTPIIEGSALPLLQPKELNNRERRREIETQKKQRSTEIKKNKKRQLSVDLSIGEFDQAIKKLKAEKPNCVVCNQEYDDHTTLK